VLLHGNKILKTEFSVKLEDGTCLICFKSSIDNYNNVRAWASSGPFKMSVSHGRRVGHSWSSGYVHRLRIDAGYESSPDAKKLVQQYFIISPYISLPDHVSFFHTHSNNKIYLSSKT